MTVPEQVGQAAAGEGDEHIAPSAGGSRYFTNDFVDCLGGADAPAIDGAAAHPREGSDEAGPAGAARG